VRPPRTTVLGGRITPLTAGPYISGRAYAEGRRLAEAESGRRDALFRGYVLYVVVAAIVLLPFVAILLQLKPETFGSYVAPVTGIAGTIVGYWFGSSDRPRGAAR
jgi:hypothetical protein